MKISKQILYLWNIVNNLKINFAVCKLMKHQKKNIYNKEQNQVKL